MAFAIASGARPEQGLYTAIVAGLCTSLFGGTRLQVSGPTGAFIAVLAVITAQHGIAGLQVATLMAGLILLVMGSAKLGSVIKFIPDPVIVGFTSGIGLIIFVGEWKDFFGLHPAPSGLHFHQRLGALLEALPHLHPATTALASLALLILIFGTRFLRRVPSPLVAMVVVTLLQWKFDFAGVATLGTAFGGIPMTLPRLQLPLIDFATVIQLVGHAPRPQPGTDRAGHCERARPAVRRLCRDGCDCAYGDQYPQRREQPGRRNRPLRAAAAGHPAVRAVGRTHPAGGARGDPVLCCVEHERRTSFSACAAYLAAPGHRRPGAHLPADCDH
jgi:hypothetical protein